MDAEILGTAAGVAAGFVGGHVLEYVAAQGVAARRGNIEAVQLALAHDQDQAPRPTMMQRAREVGRRVLPLLAVFGAAAGGTEAYGWTGDSVVTHSKPVVEVVVDHSGATSLPIDGPPAIGRINSIASAFAGTKYGGDAIVSTLGSNDEVSFSKVAHMQANQTAGEAPLDAAVSLAFDNLGSNTGGNQRNGMLVVTYGNNIGSLDSIVGLAHKKNIEINIANAGVSETDPGVANELKRIAKDTHGTYWDANQEQPAAIAQAVTANLSSKVEAMNTPARWPARILGAVALLATAGLARGRGRYALNRGPRG